LRRAAHACRTVLWVKHAALLHAACSSRKMIMLFLIALDPVLRPFVAVLKFSACMSISSRFSTTCFPPTCSCSSKTPTGQMLQVP
jgi:hypothetical protein